VNIHLPAGHRRDHRTAQLGFGLLYGSPFLPLLGRNRSTDIPPAEVEYRLVELLPRAVRSCRCAKS
jgi:hypothetical protein